MSARSAGRGNDAAKAIKLALRIQHGRNQQGEHVVLGLALAGQSTLQIRRNPGSQLRDPTGHPESAPKRAGSLNHKQIQRANASSGKLIGGKHAHHRQPDRERGIEHRHLSTLY
jgi:hypothetical protein